MTQKPKKTIKVAADTAEILELASKLCGDDITFNQLLESQIIHLEPRLIATVEKCESEIDEFHEALDHLAPLQIFPPWSTYCAAILRELDARQDRLDDVRAVLRKVFAWSDARGRGEAA